jgi:hypothetical protein
MVQATKRRAFVLKNRDCCNENSGDYSVKAFTNDEQDVTEELRSYRTVQGDITARPAVGALVAAC